VSKLLYEYSGKNSHKSLNRKEVANNALREGQECGLVRSDVNPNERAIFLVTVEEGYLSLAKNSQDAWVLRAGKEHPDSPSGIVAPLRWSRSL
jgi:hypothetical protein